MPEVGVHTAGAASNPVGTLPGDFDVDGEGAATYSVPIEVPPGLQGVQPSLKLAYRSNAGDGLLGVGWTLTGLSAISRCPSTVAQDNLQRGIQYDDLDRFCLDGRRLIATSGVYGADGTEYRTEIESWSRIYSRGRCGNGPCSFTVQSKNGEQVEFGATTDSRVLANGKSTVRVWALNKLTGPEGNYLTVSYLQQEGQYYPNDIQYTFNPANALLKRRRVAFTYATRPDPILSYAAGSQVRTSLRLTFIRTYLQTATGEALVREYRLGYTQPVQTGASRRSLLTSILGCDAAGVCLPATQLTWHQLAMDGFTRVTPPSDYQDLLRFDPGANIIPGDFNGDGKTDFLRQERGDRDNDCGNTFNVYLSRGDGLFDIVTPNANNEQCELRSDNGANIITGDFNGDGRTDFLRQEKGSWDDDCDSTFNVFFSLGNGNFTKVTPNTNGEQCELKFDDGANIIPGDFNGDGRTDFLRQEKGSWDNDCANTFNVFFSRGDGFFDKVTPDTNAEQCDMRGDFTNVFTADYNGDGRTDFLRQEKGSWDDSCPNNFNVFFSRGDGFFTKVTPDTNGEQCDLKADDGATIIPGDYNNDGRADFIRQERGAWDDDCGNTFNVFFSRGDGFFDKVTPDTNAEQCDMKGDLTNLFTADVNGDGKTDLLRQERGSLDDACPNNFNVFFSRGDGFFDKLSPDTNGEQCLMKYDDGSFVIPGDYNGDGRSDFLRQEHSGWDNDLADSFLVFFARGTREPDLMASVQNGLGGRTEVDYGPLTDSAVYQKGSGATAGNQDIQGPIYVARAYRQTGRRVATGTHRFSYTAARANLQGRGWLGFGTVTHVNEAAGTTLVTTYHQAFPLTGAIQSVDLQGPTGVRTVTTYEYDTPLSATAVYQVRKTAERLSHTEGGLTYTTRGEYVYDGFGNLALVRDLGREADASDDLFTCTTYSNNATTWKLGLPTEVYAASSCTLSGTTCGCTGVLKREQRTYTTDGRDNLASVSHWDDGNSVWLTTTHAYDTYGNLTQRTSPSGGIERTTYDTDYQTFPVQVEQTDGAGISLITRFTYDAAFGEVLTRTDTNNRLWTHTLDGFGRIVGVASPSPSGAQVTVRTVAWLVDANGDIYEETQRRTDWGVTDWHWERQYPDGQGRIWQRTSRGPDATRASITQTYTFDAAGRLTAESLPFFPGQTAASKSTQYDARGRVVQVTDPSGSITRLQYAVDTTCPGCVRRITTTEGFGTASARSWTHHVDAYERILRQTDPAGRSATFTYNRLGQQLTSSEPKGSVTYTYDSLGRQRSLTTSDTGTTSYTYNTVGFLASSTDARGQRIDFQHDKLGRLVTKTVVGVETVRYTYDNTANLNGRGRLTGVSITRAGQTVPESSQSFAYTAEGLVQADTLTLDGQSYSHSRTYDSMGRPRNLTYPDSSTLGRTYNLAGFLEQLAIGTTVHARYTSHNAAGQPLQSQYGNGTTTTHGYDGALRLASSATSTAGGVKLLDYGYTWNVLQHLTQLADRRDTTRTQNFTYSVEGYLTQAQGVYGTHTFGYDEAGNLTSKQGVTYTYQNHRVTSGTDGFSATYDASGNRITHNRGGAAWAFQYDGERRLQEVRRNNVVVNRFTYDFTGQRLKKVDADGTTTLYVSPVYEITLFPDGRRVSTRYVDAPEGRIAAISTALPAGASLVADPAAYDVEARLYDPGTASGLLKLADNRLQKWAHTPVDLSALGRALSALVAAGALLLLARQTHTGRRLAGLLARGLARLGVLSPRRAEAWGRLPQTDFTRRHPLLARLVPAVLAAMTLTSCEQTWTLTPLGVREDPALSSGANGLGYPVAGTVYFHQNHLGSTHVVTNTSGAEVARVEYLPFGEMYAPASNGQDIFRPKYTGQEWDKDSGLYYYNARYYDAVTGRFMTSDSYQQGGPAHLIASLNRYAYAVNDPLRYTDPSGHIAWVVVGIVIGVLAGAYVGGATVNGSFNPANWAWGNWRTWVGIGVGALVGGLSAGAAALATGPVMAGLSAGFIEGVGMGGLRFLSPDGSSAETFFQDVAISMALGVLTEVGIDKLARVVRSASAAEPVSLEARVCKGASCNCFSGDTPVLTPEGPRPIQDIQPGDLVAARDEATGEQAWKPVTQVFVTPDKPLVALEVESEEGEREVIHTTAEHPFYVQGDGFTPVSALRPGDALVDSEERTLRVRRITPLERRETVFNLEVAGFHTFFAGHLRAFVHNMCGGKRTYNLRSVEIHSYQVSAPDLNTGTATTAATRQAVNSVAMAPPAEVGYVWATATRSGAGRVPNPAPAPGRRWDAGHLLGRQNGGAGHLVDEVFPQNPAINRGNYLNGQPTRQLWREHEDAFHDAVGADGEGQWVVKLYKRQRT
jgi:RHS repeat-associated protein